jgi:SAM-dependent methyltransferase
MDASRLYRADFRYDKELVVDGLAPTYARALECVRAGSTVLEIGCHTGYFSRLLRERGCRVIGVEINAEAAARAVESGLDVRVGNVEDAGLVESLPRGIDVLLAMDVLEHLLDPWTTLRNLRDRLHPDGRAVISLPNIGCWAVMRALMRGRFDYADGGPLDRTHLRFFTYRTARELIQGAGFAVREWWPTMTSVPAAGKLGAIPILRPLVERGSIAAARRFPGLCGAQFLFHCGPEASAEGGSAFVGVDGALRQGGSREVRQTP